MLQYQSIRKVDTLALEWDTIRFKILAFEWKGVNPDTVGRSCELICQCISALYSTGEGTSKVSEVSPEYNLLCDTVMKYLDFCQEESEGMPQDAALGTRMIPSTEQYRNEYKYHP